MTEKIARAITNHPKIVVIIAVLLLIPSAFGYFNTFVNYDILSYLPDNLNSVQGEKILDETFHEASSAILLIDDMQPKDVAKIKQQIEKIDNVTNVTWTDDIADISIPVSMLPDVMKNIFYSEDGSCTLMLINFGKNSASEETMQSIKDIRAVMTKQCFLSGMSTIIADTKSMADEQAPIYIAIAIALALVVMSFTMESWVLPLVLLTSLGIAVVYNMGSNVMFGQISYITQCIAAILQLGVTMDYSVFLIDRFDEEKQKNSNLHEAMAVAIRETFVSLLGSSLTTVFGFLALCFMSLTLGMDIGIVMAKGVVFGIITVVTVLPALVLLLNKPIYRFKHKKMVPKFDKVNDFTIKHRKVIAIIFLALIIPAYIAQSKVDVYYDMTQALPQDLDSISSLNKMKDDFNMATTHFVAVHTDVPSGKITKMVDEIEKLDGINSIVSLNSFVGTGIDTNILPDSIKAICEKDGLRMMLVNSTYSSATDEANDQIEKISDIVTKYDPEGYLTGEGVLTKDLITITDRDFKITSIISIAAIFLLIAVVFKSVSVPVLLVSLIEFAIIINKAIPFFTGEVIPFIGPTIIGCVQLGATVDYAILMATRFRQELRRGNDKLTALKTAANASCSSIFQSALVFFSATFGVYLICDILIVKSICAMLARGSVISALVIILVLTPMLFLCEGIINKTTIGWRREKSNKKDTAAEERIEING